MHRLCLAILLFILLSSCTSEPRNFNKSDYPDHVDIVETNLNEYMDVTTSDVDFFSLNTIIGNGINYKPWGVI